MHSARRREYKQKYMQRPENKFREFSGHLRRKYGLMRQQYDAMLTAQSGRCKICGSNDNDLHVDHCHTTGEVRGLLCSHCNYGIGRFRHDVNLLMAAIRYLSEKE